MGNSVHKKTSKKESQGGLAFFLSLIFLCVLSLINICALPALLDSNAIKNLFEFCVGIGVGCFIAGFIIVGRLSIYIHELKHSIISSLAGNESKGIKVKKESGEFKYKYSDKTAEYNAFISLAPYFFPFFTIPAVAASAFLLADAPIYRALVIGIAFGADLLMNIRDLGPHQTDLTTITGGYWVGVSYVTVMNLTISTYLLAWVMQASFGVRFLFYGVYKLMLALVAYYSNGQTG